MRLVVISGKAHWILEILSDNIDDRNWVAVLPLDAGVAGDRTELVATVLFRRVRSTGGPSSSSDDAASTCFRFAFNWSPVVSPTTASPTVVPFGRAPDMHISMSTNSSNANDVSSSKSGPWSMALLIELATSSSNVWLSVSSKVLLRVLSKVLSATVLSRNAIEDDAVESAVGDGAGRDGAGKSAIGVDTGMESADKSAVENGTSGDGTCGDGAGGDNGIECAHDIVTSCCRRPCRPWSERQSEGSVSVVPHCHDKRVGQLVLHLAACHIFDL
jgi:hypothetical protein